MPNKRELFVKETGFYPSEGAEKAMDIYSQQQAIAFAEWTQKNYFEQDDDGFWYKWMLRSKEEKTYTTEQLYELFLQSQNQTP